MEPVEKGLRMWNLVLIATSTVVGVGVWLIFGKSLPPQIPLWYSRPWGEAQLARPEMLLILPGIAILTGFALNFLGGRLGGERVLAGMVFSTSIVVQMVLILALLRIILLVV